MKSIMLDSAERQAGVALHSGWLLATIFISAFQIIAPEPGLVTTIIWAGIGLLTLFGATRLLSRSARRTVERAYELGRSEGAANE